jgi:hypothetical protein
MTRWAYTTKPGCTLSGVNHAYGTHDHVIYDGRDMPFTPSRQVIEEPEFVYLWLNDFQIAGSGWDIPASGPGDWNTAMPSTSFRGVLGRNSYYANGHLYIVEVDGPVIRAPKYPDVGFTKGRIIYEIDLSPLSDPTILAGVKDKHWAGYHPTVRVRKLKPLIDPDRELTLRRVRAEAVPLLAQMDGMKQRQDNYWKLRGVKPMTATDWPEYRRVQRELNALRKLANNADFSAPPLSADPAAFPPGPLRTYMERGR